MDQLERVSKKDMDEYQGKVKHGQVFESIRMSIKERLNMDEYLNQYERVLKEDTDKYQGKFKHIRVFESIWTGIKRRYRRVSKKG